MEARVARKSLWLLLALTVLLRLPFRNTPVQGDDHIYITEAQHALIDPLHPNNVKYIFIGDEVDLRGHSHPPGNAWFLAGLLAIFGDVRELPFHAAYIVFSLIAVASMWHIAVRFTNRPGWATLLFIAVPAFQVNGNSFESDLPFLAFWLAAIALFPRFPLLSALAMAGAAMTAYQAVFLIPVLGVYVWLFDRKNVRRWLLLAAPAATVAVWQIFTRLTTGTAPASELAGYLISYKLLSRALSGAAMLLIHSWFIVFPALVPFAMAAAWRRRREPDTIFLLCWIAIFLACGLPIFFAGSARYLLPIAAPVAILASRLPVKWVAPAFAVQLALALGLTLANCEHWDGYRNFAASLAPPAPGHRIWVDNDWGLRYYLEARGALPARKGQLVRPGDIVVTSDLSSNVRYTVPFAPLAEAAITPILPLRLIGLDSHSGYSTVDKGFWPFGISTGPADRVHARLVMERRPTLEYVTPKSSDQIISGIDPSDGWTAKSATVLLKTPDTPKTVRAEIYVSPDAKARQITLLLDNVEVARFDVPASGKYVIDSAQPHTGSTLEIRVDRTFRAPGDIRDLGIVLLAAGFV
jgi:hypothetical protein